jgi:hypothetical protein
MVASALTPGGTRSDPLRPLKATRSGNCSTCALGNQLRSGLPRMPGALDTTCASPCGNITTSPAKSCTEGPPGMPAQQLPCATAWYSITCSTPRISSGAISRAGGASAAQSSLPLT